MHQVEAPSRLRGACWLQVLGAGASGAAAPHRHYQRSQVSGAQWVDQGGCIRGLHRLKRSPNSWIIGSMCPCTPCERPAETLLHPPVAGACSRCAWAGPSPSPHPAWPAAPKLVATPAPEARSGRRHASSLSGWMGMARAQQVLPCRPRLVSSRHPVHGTEKPPHINAPARA